MSGLHAGRKTSEMGMNIGRSRSTYKSCSATFFWRIHSATDWRRMRLWRCLYRSRAIGEAQFDKTCLFVWGLADEQSVQFGSVVVPHLARFADVGSCCKYALLTKLNRGCDRDSTNVVHSSIFDFGIISETVRAISPCESRAKKWVFAFSTWSERSFFIVCCLLRFSVTSAPGFTFLRLVSAQSFRGWLSENWFSSSCVCKLHFICKHCKSYDV